MAFISATWQATKKTVSINVNQIISVAQIGDNTVISTSGQAANGGPLAYYVSESLEDITSRIDHASR